MACAYRIVADMLEEASVPAVVISMETLAREEQIVEHQSEAVHKECPKRP